MKPRRGSRLEETVAAATQRAREANPMCGFSVLFGSELIGFFLSEVARRVLESGEPLRVPKFGTFRRVQTKERSVRHPKTGEPVRVPAQTRLAFSAAAHRRKRT